MESGTTAADESTTALTAESTVVSSEEPSTSPTFEQTRVFATETTMESGTTSTDETTTALKAESTIVSSVEPSTSPTFEQTTVFATETTMESGTTSTHESTTALTADTTTVSSVEPNTSPTFKQTTVSATETTMESETTSTVESTTALTTDSTVVSSVQPSTSPTFEQTTVSATETTMKSGATSTVESTTALTTESTVVSSVETSTSPTFKQTSDFTTETTTGSTMESSTVTSIKPSTKSPTSVAKVASNGGLETTQPNTPTASTEAAVVTKQISFTTSETFNADLLVSTSSTFINRAASVKSEFEPVFKQAFSTFIRLNVLGFKAGSIITNLNLEFSASLPSDNNIVDTVLNAKTSFAITQASVTTAATATPTPETTTTTTTTTTPPPTTTTTSTTTTTTTTTPPPTTTTTPSTTTTATTTPTPTRPPPAVALTIVINQVYEVALSDTNSNQFKVLATIVQAAMDLVYKAQYGALFIMTKVKGFRPGATRATDIETDLELIFNENSTKPLPSSTDVVSTLKEAISNPSSGFNLAVDPAKIVVVSAPQTIPVIFQTNGTFVSALSDSTSTLFGNRSLAIKQELEPFFTVDYPAAFSQLVMTNFSNGGLSLTLIQNHMDLYFGASATLPNSTQIANTLVRAAKNNTLPFMIFTSQITVNGTVISSGEISSKISLFTAAFMVTLSLLLTRYS
ncbi:uncharacterized protein LOC111197087 isoform X27 [Astyanax mexicanus]|nr:uncharacterized protein LOC111197087 isoform X27 [Astyanax mexicanus]